MGYSLTITFVGDIMCGSDYPSPKNLPPKPSAFFNSVKSYLTNADLTIGNLEGAIANKQVKRRYKGKRAYNFRMPPYTAKMLRLGGFDIVNLANNHSYDFGDTGLQQTVRYLQEQNIAPAGIKGLAFKTNIGKTNITVLGFSTYYYHNNLLEIEEAKKYIQSHAKSDVLIVSFHGGAEGESHTLVPKTNEYYYGEPRGDVYRFAHAAVDAGADIVVGHGPHVLRGIEYYKKKLIAYSLGNFAGYQLFSVKGGKGISAILTLEVNKKGNFLKGQINSISLRPLGRPIPDRTGEGIKKIAALSDSNFMNSPLIFSTDGSIKIPSLRSK